MTRLPGGPPGARRERLAGALILAAAFVVCGTRPARSGTQQPSAVSPPLEFRGPGRDLAEPAVSEVVLGWFGPDDPDHAEFGEFWRGATLAIARENREGGYRPRSGSAAVPFRLDAAWSDSPWKAGVLGISRLIQEQGAWAIVGGVDGTTTHLAVQLALKTFFTLLSPGSSDVTADRANVPWLFSLPPSDERTAPLLVDAVSAGGGSFVILAGTDHDSRATLGAFHRALRARSLAPSAQVEVVGDDDVPAVAARLREARPAAVLLLAPAVLGAHLVQALRGSGFSGTIVGGAPFARAAFRRAAGAAADGVVVPTGVQRGAGYEEFARDYRQRWGEPPDEAALQSYDAVRLVIAAVRRAGLNRALIRDAVRALAPWPGAAGSVVWDARGRNERASGLGVVRGATVVPLAEAAASGASGGRVLETHGLVRGRRGTLR